MKKILIGIAVLTGFGIKAQQDAMYTHYAFNTLNVNPGYAGSRDALTITGLHRSQWVGFEGAPVTQTLTLHAPVASEKIGLGLTLINDKIGPTNMTSAYADFAYKIPVSAKGTLSLGLKGGINIMQAGLANLQLDDNIPDPTFQNRQSDILPNFGFGLYYSTTKWYLGLSTPKLLENDYKSNTTTGSVDGGSEKRHFFAIAGTVFNLNSSGSVKLKPTTFVKVTEAAPIEADLTGMFIFNDKVEAGIMGRTGDAVGLLLGYNFTPQLRFGYSFDWSFVNKTATYNAGSHEVMLRYDFIMNDKGRIRSPRYF